MNYDMGNASHRTSKLVFLLCVAALVGLAVFLSVFVLKTAKSLTDITIQSDLQPRLHAFPQTNGAPLKVIVSQGTVRLEGTVTDQYEHEAILEVARQGSGKDKIEDALKIMLPQSNTPEGGYRYQT